MKRASFILKLNIVFFLFSALILSSVSAQTPDDPEGPGGNNNTGTRDNGPNFGLGDNDTWNMQIPAHPSNNTMQMDKFFMFSDDPNSGNDEIKIILTFTDPAGNALNVLTPNLNSNQLVLQYDLSNLPTDVTHTQNSKINELAFPVDITLQAPANYQKDSTQLGLIVHYAIYGKDTAATNYSLIMGQSSNDFLNFNLEMVTPIGGSKRLAANGFSELSLKAFPNPFSNYLNVEIEGTDASNIQILDLQGRQQIFQSIPLQSSGNKSTYRLNLSSLTPGVYMLRIPGDKRYRAVRLLKTN